MSASAAPPPLIPPAMLSDALAALGVYEEPPTREQLAAAEAEEGTAALRARLANALYGSALAHVMSAEYAAATSQLSNSGYRAAAWQAAGATPEGTAILLHYSAMRLASDLRAVLAALPVDLGVMGAAAESAEALKLLLEVSTVRSMDDPRAERITTNLARAQDQLSTAAERIGALFQAGRDVAATLTGQQRRAN